MEKIFEDIRNDEIENLEKAFEAIEKHDVKVETVFIPRGEEGEKIIEDLKKFNDGID